MSNRFKTTGLSLCLVLSLAGSASPGIPDFDTGSYLRHLRFLASDELGGRGNGTPELDRAADYIAAQFKTIGLQPAGEAGSYFQSLQIPVGHKLGPNYKLTLRIGQETIQARITQDFLPFAIGDKNRLSGQVVFGGYGISAEEQKYDDYKDLDVTDKIVLVMSHEPRENDATSSFDGTELTIHGHDRTKTQTARYRNALAVLIVEDPANHPATQETLADPALAAEIEEQRINAIRISRSLAQRMLQSQQRDLSELQKQIDEKLSPQSFALANVEAEIEVDATRIQKTVRNVVGLLPGANPSFADETIVIGAHYDHLGRGGRSSMDTKLIGEIHNGADDNASGAAGLIELAAALERDLSPRRRAYLFIAFAGEELGIYGSSYWTTHPTRPLEKVVAMLNMDMIGRVRDNKVILGGIGTSPVFPASVESAARAAGLAAKSTRSGYARGDHTSFYVKNVPVLFFFSDLHSDYHRPTDDWDRINAEGATRILSMVYRIAEGLNAADSRPQFTKVDEPMTTGGVRGGGRGYGASFGSVPDMTADVRGVRFSDVRPNSPAAKAGLQGGDVMIRFAGKEVTSLQDFSYLLGNHKPGDVVEVTVLRKEQPITVEVKLEAGR